jgi:hypothetical protein
MSIKYATVAGKEACFPEPVGSISCCGRFQVSFPNQSCILIGCDNSVWMVIQPDFKNLCVVCHQRPHEGNSQWLQFMNAVRGKANVHPVFPSTVYQLDIPRMRVVTIQCQDFGIFFRWLHKTDKCLNLCVTFSFWNHPAM